MYFIKNQIVNCLNLINVLKIESDLVSFFARDGMGKQDGAKKRNCQKLVNTMPKKVHEKRSFMVNCVTICKGKRVEARRATSLLVSERKYSSKLNSGRAVCLFLCPIIFIM